MPPGARSAEIVDLIHPSCGQQAGHCCGRVGRQHPVALTAGRWHILVRTQACDQCAVGAQGIPQGNQVTVAQRRQVPGATQQQGRNDAQAARRQMGQGWGSSEDLQSGCMTSLTAARASIRGARLRQMNARVGHLLDEVLGLPAEERSALVVALLDSLEIADDVAVSELWRAEVNRRRTDLRAGRVKAAPWAEVRQRLSSL